MKKWNGKTLLRKEIDLTHQRTGTVVGRGEANVSGIASSNTSDSNLHEESNWLVCAPESRAVAYINNLGGTVSKEQLSCWTYQRHYGCGV